MLVSDQEINTMKGINHENWEYALLRKDLRLRNLPTRKKAEANPKSFMARLWYWQCERQHQVELGKEEKQLTN